MGLRGKKKKRRKKKITFDGQWEMDRAREPHAIFTAQPQILRDS
jgi:hypothetical protein